MTVPRWRFGEDPGPVIDVVAAGGVIAIPTESSYGLAVDPANPEAVARVFALKGRPDEKALPVVTASIDVLPVHLHPGPETNLAALWPAALTLVLDLDRSLAAAGDGETLAVRVPDHSGLLELLRVTGPLTATSANRSGRPPALAPGDAADLLAAGDAPGLVVDAGELPGGPPSSLVRVDGVECRVLRQGAVPEATIRTAAEAPLAASSTGFVENSADD